MMVTLSSAMPESLFNSSYKNQYDQRNKDHHRRAFSTTPLKVKVPSIDKAEDMKAKLSEMENETLLTIAHMGNHQAGCEVLKRHIMATEGVDYKEACVLFAKIEAANQGFNLVVLPYVVGIGAGMLAAFGSLPLVFDLNTAIWFNEACVTTDVPDPRDLETMLEVGSWTWNWMEPPLGTMSFALLSLQFARAQIQNLGLHPYTRLIIKRRAVRLANQFPQYDRELIFLYSESEPLVNNMYRK